MAERQDRGDNSSSSRDDRPPRDSGIESSEERNTDARIDELVREANEREQSTPDLGLGGFKGNDSEAEPAEADIQDLDEAYEEWYSNSWSVIMKTIEQGELRYAILDLRTLYLREGRLDNDSRFARRTQRRKVEEVVLDWLMEYGGDHPGRLLHALFELNKEAGYRPERVL